MKVHRYITSLIISLFSFFVLTNLALAEGGPLLYPIDNGLIDQQGNLIIKINNWESIRPTHEGITGITTNDRSVRFIDATGQQLFNNKYYQWGSDSAIFYDGLALISVDAPSKEGIFSNLAFIDKTGNLAFKVNYDSVGHYSEGLAMVGQQVGGKNYKYGFIDTKGNLVIPMQFKHLNKFSEGLARITVGDKYGYIDKSGKVVIPPTYTNANDFHEGLAAVRMNGKTGYINKQGKVMIKAIFISMFGVDNGRASDFHDGVAIASKSNQPYGGDLVIDHTGKVIVDTKVKTKRDVNLGPFMNGFALAQITRSSKTDYNETYNYLDKKGNFLFKKDLVSAKEFKNGLALVVKKIDPKTGQHDTGYINEKGIFVYSYSYISGYTDK